MVSLQGVGLAQILCRLASQSELRLLLLITLLLIWIAMLTLLDSASQIYDNHE
mgnify:CR=1 FL=1